MTGGVVSTTRTVEAQELALPEPSVAEHATGVRPSGKVEPDCGQAAASVPQQVSLDVAANDTTAPAGLAHSCWMAPGHVMSGRVVSTTVTAKPQLASLPAMSVAVQDTGEDPRRKD